MSVASYPGFPADNFTPLFFQVDGSTGCTLTRAQIRPFTKDDFAAQGLKEVGMDKTIAQMKEARMAGVQQKGLTDLLLSRHVKVNEGAVQSNGSIIAPFTLLPRRNVVNINYWLVTAGSATQPADPASAWASTLPATVYYLTVKVSTTGYGTQITNLDRYFLPGMYVFVESTARHVGSDWQTYVGGGNIDSSVSLQFRVIGAVMKSGSSDTAYVAVAPTEFQSLETSSSAWTTYKANTTPDSDGITPQQKASRSFVTKGTLLILANSVSDYESWCYQPPSINDKTLVEYWKQTIRWTHQYNDEYLKALTAPLTSEFYKKFRTLPIAEQRRQQEALMEKAFYNTVFYGDAISDKQTLATWTDLPTVDDLTNPGCSLEYKSNTIGIRNQLSEASKVIDNNGGALNLDTLFEIFYTLKRERGNDGTDISMIDTMTDRFTKAKIRELMIRYYKAKFSMDVMVNMQPNQKVVDSVSGRTVFEYDKYDLPDQGVSFSVFTDTYFDDRLGASQSLGASSGTKNRARSLHIIDWSDIQIGLHGTRSVKRQTNVADNLYNCTITQNVNHYMLNSKTIEVRVGNPNRHTIIENFSDACPTVTYSNCTPTAS